MRILEGYRSLTPSGPCPLTDEFQPILAEVDKTKKGGRGLKKAAKKETAKEGPFDAVKPPSKKRKAPAASTAAPKRRKQPSKRRKSPTPTSSQSKGEDEPVRTEEQDYVHIEEVEQVHNEPPVRSEAPSPNREIPPPLNDYVHSPPPSPKTTTSIPITITPPPPPISSQPPTTILVSIHIFTKSTISTHASVAPISSVNVFDMGANTSGFSSHVTPPISPIRSNNPEMIFEHDEDDDLDGFAYSPF
ncbi:pollen-specific leucine-rich repeat extensin-like protein 2 [Lactuca sativa]|uniref:pollen-specific leucine-rich repeat extensin-like protein 2 n=1 Tax=Lactuca sativa TaxID=4236 RepID=UPI0022AE5741|nr:pollen-specific leucine-rich repeat extensin-like protein 2 [Lactuca sativa]